MISVKFDCFDGFIKKILPDPKTKHYNNTQLLLEYTIESNKEKFLGEYIIKTLIEKDVYTLLITQEGNSSFYIEDPTDVHILVTELTVSDAGLKNYEFKKFGQIPLNENKILFTINNVINEFAGKNWLFIVFDSLSELILWLDFNTTYKFMRKCISNLRRVKQVSSCFLINKPSHSPQILSSFENLFDGVIVSKAENDCDVKGTIKYRYIIH